MRVIRSKAQGHIILIIQSLGIDGFFSYVWQNHLFRPMFYILLATTYLPVLLVSFF